MIRRPPRSTRTVTLFPYTTLFLSLRCRLLHQLDIGSTGENAVVDGIALGDHRCPHARLIGGKTTRQIQPPVAFRIGAALRSEEHTSELQSLMRISYAVFCLKKKKLLLTTYNTYTIDYIPLLYNYLYTDHYTCHY